MGHSRFARKTCPRILIVILITLFVLIESRADLTALQAQAQLRYGEYGLHAVNDWMRLMAAARGLPVAEQVRRVNEFFNTRIAFADDATVWQVEDYWATPLESLGGARGDCEDFAIAKYASLVALGVPEAQLRLIYVAARLPGAPSEVPHMVLGYYPEVDAEPQILDNLVGTVEWASARKDLKPVFSFNGAGLWAAGRRAPGDPTQRLSRWRDVLLRIQREGVP